MNWNYIAGFYEGEGSCGCYFRSTKKSWVLQAAISQKYRPVLMKIRDFLKKGSICKTNLDCYIYQIAANDARQFLNELLPYCQAPHKIKQIKTALKVDKENIAVGQGNRLKRRK